MASKRAGSGSAAKKTSGGQKPARERERAQRTQVEIADPDAAEKIKAYEREQKARALPAVKRRDPSEFGAGQTLVSRRGAGMIGDASGGASAGGSRGRGPTGGRPSGTAEGAIDGGTTASAGSTGSTGSTGSAGSTSGGEGSAAA